MKFAMIMLALVSADAFAIRGEVTLSEECKAKLENEVVRNETQYLQSTGEVIASEIKTGLGLSYWPNRQEVSIGVMAEDELDGRFVRWTAKVPKADARACRNIKLVRQTKTACRYSRQEGPDSLNEIKGITFQGGRTIAANASLSKIEEEQIRAFLAEGDQAASVADLINGTDDSELSTGLLTLPDGRTLDYYGAYGGDNPYGRFFLHGTATLAGDNSDGSVCIDYLAPSSTKGE